MRQQVLDGGQVPTGEGCVCQGPRQNANTALYTKIGWPQAAALRLPTVV